MGQVWKRKGPNTGASLVVLRVEGKLEGSNKVWDTEVDDRGVHSDTLVGFV